MLKPAEIAHSLESWEEHVSRALPLLRDQHTVISDQSSDKQAVFLETRRGRFSEFSIRNVMHFLGPDWGLQLCVPERHETWFRKLLGSWGDLIVHPIPTPQNNTDSSFLNRRMRRTEFWSGLHGENLFFFDANSLIRKPISQRYMDFCYTGSPWSAKRLSPWCRIGDGKLSMRRKSSMLDVISRCNTNSHLIDSEDVFFSIAMHLEPDRYSLPDLDTATEFSVQQIYHPDPYCLHQPWKYMDRKSLDILLANIQYEYSY